MSGNMKVLLLAGEESGVLYAERLRRALPGCEFQTYQDHYKTSDLVGITDTAARAGMVLNILMKCDPKGSEATAAELAAFLAGRIRKDDGCWGTTQANAWASMGLAAFAEHFPPAELSGSLAAPGKEKQALSGKAVNGFELATSSTNTVSNSGKGNLYVRTVVSGVPKDAKPSAGPIRLKREFFDEKGNPVTNYTIINNNLHIIL